MLVGHLGVDVALADLGSRVQELQKYVHAVNENVDDVDRDEMTPLHLLQTLLNLGTKNLCSWGTSLGNDEGQEQNLDDA